MDRLRQSALLAAGTAAGFAVVLAVAFGAVEMGSAIYQLGYRVAVAAYLALVGG